MRVHVGSHAGYALVSQNLVEEIVYIDVDEKKALAQALDLYDSTLYLHKGARVKAGDYSDLEDASLVIISAVRFRISQQAKQEWIHYQRQLR